MSPNDDPLVHADAMREHDDVALVYRAACGDFHWRCYECEPTRRSGHHPSLESARDDLAVHLGVDHKGLDVDG